MSSTTLRRSPYGRRIIAAPSGLGRDGVPRARAVHLARTFSAGAGAAIVLFSSLAHAQQVGPESPSTRASSEPPSTPAPAQEAAAAPRVAGDDQPTAAPLASPTVEQQTTNWSSGYHNGNFYVRSPNDVFRLYVQGRVHVDDYNWIGPGVAHLTPDQALKNGFELRRARFEIGGEFFEQWQWQLGAEFAPSAADDVAANTASLSCKVDPTSSLLTCSPRQNTVEAPSVKPAPTDAFINFAPSPWANVQVGQFYLPFTMENRISDNTTAFLERSMAVRDLGAPLQRDIGAMFWGESPDRLLYYSAGIFNGDGPNRPNADSRYDFAGRVFVRPFVNSAAGSTKWAQLGASVHAGSRDATQVGYDMPALTTQQGFAFWKPTYTDSFGRLVHIIPSGAQTAVAGDVYVPVGNFDFTGELVYVHYDTREAVDGLQLSPFTERLGELKGYGYYAQVAYWILGDHDILGYPSYQRPIHVDLSKPQATPQHGVQAVGRFEQLHVNYAGSDRGGTDDAKTPSGDVDVTSFTLGLNYWATRHLRVSVDYGFYLFPNSAPVTPSSANGPVQTSAQRAVAPAQNLPKGVDDGARDGGHTLHEISARVGVQF